jgi:hypothetical protein
VYFGGEKQEAILFVPYEHSKVYVTAKRELLRILDCRTATPVIIVWGAPPQLKFSIRNSISSSVGSPLSDVS